MTDSDKKTPLWKRLAALAVGAVLAALALELAVTAFVGEQPKFPRRVVGAPFGVRINDPGARYRHRSADIDVSFRINSRGLRSDVEYPYEKPEGVVRIVSLGDSFTMGYEVEVEETFNAVLERELRERGHEVEVINAGVSGFSNAEQCLYLERELLRYEPDIVLLSFFVNDLRDNVRAGIFELADDGSLVQVADAYVPLGGVGDFLNSNAVFNFLSERSNAFAWAKETVTRKLKRGGARGEVAASESVGPHDLVNIDAPPSGGSNPRAQLAAAILDRIYAVTREAGADFVVQSIPAQRNHPERLEDQFPLAHFDVERPGLHYVATAPLLEPHADEERLYWSRSHWHWTPFSHRISGEALADLVEREILANEGAPE